MKTLPVLPHVTEGLNMLKAQQLVLTSLTAKQLSQVTARLVPGESRKLMVSRSDDGSFVAQWVKDEEIQTEKCDADLETDVVGGWDNPFYIHIPTDAEEQQRLDSALEQVLGDWNLKFSLASQLSPKAQDIMALVNKEWYLIVKLIRLWRRRGALDFRNISPEDVDDDVEKENYDPGLKDKAQAELPFTFEIGIGDTPPRGKGISDEIGNTIYKAWHDWALKTEMPRFKLRRIEMKNHTANVFKCCMVDSRVILTVGEDATMQQWNPKNGNCHRVYHGHKGSIRSIACWGTKVVTGSCDRNVRFWYLSSTGVMKCEKIMEGHAKDVLAVDMVDNLVASGGKDKTLRLWKFNSGECLGVLRGHTSYILSIKINRDIVYTGSSDGTFRLWDVESLKCIRTVDTQHAVTSIAVIRGGDLVVTGGSDGVLRFWDKRFDMCLHKVILDVTGEVTSLSWREPYLAAGGSSGKVYMYEMTEFILDPHDKEKLVLARVLRSHVYRALGVCMTKRGLLSCGADRKVIYHTWDVPINDPDRKKRLEYDPDDDDYDGPIEHDVDRKSSSKKFDIRRSEVTILSPRADELEDMLK